MSAFVEHFLVHFVIDYIDVRRVDLELGVAVVPAKHALSFRVYLFYLELR